MNQASLLTRVVAMVAAVALLLALPASALAAGAAVAGPSAPPGAAEEATPIDFTGASDPGASQVGGGGGSLVRTIVGLAALASVPLANGRSVHLVRAGTDLVLLGVAEQGVVPIRAYTQEEAHAAGLIDDDGMLILPDDDTAPKARPRIALPGRGSPEARAPRTRKRPRHPPLLDGPRMKAEGSNAVQILLLLGAMTLIPALLFTVTGFTRILIVLGFIRTAIGRVLRPIARRRRGPRRANRHRHCRWAGEGERS